MDSTDGDDGICRACSRVPVSVLAGAAGRRRNVYAIDTKLYADRFGALVPTCFGGFDRLQATMNNLQADLRVLRCKIRDPPAFV